jgi:hypothetical protein
MDLGCFSNLKSDYFWWKDYVVNRAVSCLNVQSRLIVYTLHGLSLLVQKEGWNETSE